MEPKKKPGWWCLEPWNLIMTFQKLGMESSSQLTFSPSFFRGVGGSTTNQLVVFGDVWLATEDLCDLKDVFGWWNSKIWSCSKSTSNPDPRHFPRHSKFYFPIPIWAPKLRPFENREISPHPRGPVFVPRPVVPLVLVPVTLPVTHAERYLFPYCVDLILVAFVLLWLASRQLNGKITQTFDGWDGNQGPKMAKAPIFVGWYWHTFHVYQFLGVLTRHPFFLGYCVYVLSQHGATKSCGSIDRPWETDDLELPYPTTSYAPFCHIKNL